MTYYSQHKDKMNKYSNEYVKERKKNDAEFRDKVRKQVRYHVKKYRLTVINHLGSSCIKCGFNDIRALQLDHINGQGGKELKEKGSISTYIYYSKHLDEAKQKLQVLCANCNWIKRSENNETKLIK